MKPNASLVLVSGLIVAAALSACSPSTSDTTSIIEDGAQELANTTAIDASSEVLDTGKSIYTTHCISCHGHDLKGGTGFNLVDSEWVHGESFDAIRDNISTGFLEAGMPGFSEILEPEQIEALTQLILAKREGWESLDYVVYPLPEGADPNFDKLKDIVPISSGRLDDGLADFDIPEVPHFVISFEGDFYAPWEQEAVLMFDISAWYINSKTAAMKVEIDGTEVEQSNDNIWNAAFKLKHGKQHLKLTYFYADPIGSDRKWHERFGSVYAAREDLSEKFAPISVAAKRITERAVHNLKAADIPLVVRIKTLDLPPYSISVGGLNQVNYAFNSRSCSIVGVWTGDLLNIGPNILGRGKEASLPLGDWSFHFPQEISLLENTADSAKNSCEFIKYTRGEQPAFFFERNDVQFQLTGTETDDGIVFDLGTKPEQFTRALEQMELSAPAMNIFRASIIEQPAQVDDGDEYETIGRVSLDAIIKE